MTHEPPGWTSTITTSALHPPRLGILREYSQRFLSDARWSNDGPLVTDLENRLASWHEVEHCVAVSSGFWALVLTSRALHERVEPSRNEVLMPSLTYRRLADAMNWVGLTPHFVDVDPRSLAMDIDATAASAGPSVGLICAVNPMAGTLDPGPMSELARSQNTPLVLDSVEAQVDEYPNKRRVGSQGDAEVFSCHSSKFLNGGEGGYVTTNDAALAQQLRIARAFGFEAPDRVVYAGFNAKMSEIQAAWILTALDGVEPQKHYYESIFLLYQWYLGDVPELLLRNTRSDSSFKNIVVEIRADVQVGAEAVVAYLNSHAAQARQYYAPPLHLKPAAYRVITKDLPVTDEISGRLFVLPSGSRLSADHVAKISRLLREFFDNPGRYS